MQNTQTIMEAARVILSGGIDEAFSIKANYKAETALGKKFNTLLSEIEYFEMGDLLKVLAAKFVDDEEEEARDAPEFTKITKHLCDAAKMYEIYTRE